MIQPIDEIPKREKQPSNREKIRDDIREAIDNDIRRFEFVGDYNFKYLAQYAREAAKDVFYDEAKSRFARMKGAEEIYLYSYDLKASKYIRISSIKGETPEKTRVFCRIDFSNLDADIGHLIADKIKIEREYAEKRQKLRMEANDETESFDFVEGLS